MLTINAATNELFLYDVIGQDWYGEGLTAKAVAEAIKPLAGKRLTVRINSPGGVVDEGIGIYNALRRHEGGVDTVNDALAASIASIIFLAGEKRTMSEGSRIMIHKALTIDIGNSTQFRKTASTLDAHDASLVEIYSRVMSKSPEEILSLMEEETWYTTQEAIDAGLATASTTASKQTAKMAAWFKKQPEAILGTAPTIDTDLQLARTKAKFLRTQLL